MLDYFYTAAGTDWVSTGSAGRGVRLMDSGNLRGKPLDCDGAPGNLGGVAWEAGIARAADYIRDWVYGGIDGAVTTFAVVAGVAGAALSTDVILILGFANLVADGFSMAAGNLSSSRTEAEQYDRLVGQVRRRIEADPERERATLRRIYREKGYADDQVDDLVATLSSNEAGWAKTMMIEEFGLAPVIRNAWMAAGSTYAAFLLCGIIPLIPYVAGLGFLVSAVMTGVVFFVIGSLRSLWTDATWLRSGLVTFAIGGTAAVMAYVIGYLLRLIVGDAAI